MSKKMMGAGFLFMGLAVALGAFGAHYLKEVLQTPPVYLKVYETAVSYHFYHALALLVLGLWVQRQQNIYFKNILLRGFWSYVVGILIFSGSLYLYVFTGARFFARFTPLGGLSFLFGHFYLAYHFWKNKSK